MSDLLVVMAIQYGLMNPLQIKMRYKGSVWKILNAAQSTLLGVINSSLAGVLYCQTLGRYDFLETHHPSVGMIRLMALSGSGLKLLRGLLIKNYWTYTA
jgi:hypothetical protein